MPGLNEALQIAGIGMGVVFLALFLLIGVLWGLNRFFPEEPRNTGQASPTAAVRPSSPGDGSMAQASAPASAVMRIDAKARAAAAAVAVALALGRERWQAASGGDVGNGLNGWRMQTAHLIGQSRGQTLGWQGRVWRVTPWRRGGP